MNEEKPQRKNRMPSSAKKKKADKMLNYLNTLMILLILITVTIIIKNAEAKPQAPTAVEEEPKSQVTQDKEAPKAQPEAESQPTEPARTETAVDDDPIVEKVIEDPAWQPTPTAQTGEHVSLYVESVDWQEKIETLSRTTGLARDNMIVLRIGNNGSAQNAIGVVTSLDGVQKYRVSMEWVDKEGWLPVKLEQLRTTEGAY